MIISVKLEMTDEEFQELWRKASNRLDTREDGTKRWTEKDKKECVRKYVNLLVNNALV